MNLRQQKAASKVAAPAIGLIVTGSFSLLMGLYRVYVLLNLDMEEQDEALDLLREQDLGVFATFMEWGVKLAPVTITLAVVGGLVVIVGAVKMMKIRSRAWGYTSAIVSILPFVTDCCCVLGLVFGIWAMVVLSNNEVKQLFAGTLDTSEVFD